MIECGWMLRLLKILDPNRAERLEDVMKMVMIYHLNDGPVDAEVSRPF